MKIFCLDTNIILSDAECIFKFEDNNVIIPFSVVEEIDTFKKDQNELGRNARAFSRYIDKLRENGKLTDGIEINDKGGKLYVVLFDQSVGNCLPFQNMDVVDNRILATTVYVKTYLKVPHDEIILVSLDTNLRIKADALGIKAEDYKNNKLANDDLYTGVRVEEVTKECLDDMYEMKNFTLDVENPIPNECFIFKCGKQSALARYKDDEFHILPQVMKTFDVQPRNVEQQFALDMLKDPDISIVSIQGKAGSGKTLVSLAAGLDAVINRRLYTKILLLKPIIAMDNSHELGFLPGSMMEKLSPWMASYSDNIEYIMQGYIKDDAPSKRRPSKKEQEVAIEKQQGKLNPILELMDLGLLEMGSLEHIRGRSLPNQYIIIDESQNLTPHALKTIITRAGEGTKIVLLGDISQIDSPYLDSRSNGLSVMVDKWKSQVVSGHITMKKSERSKLAEIASNIL